MGTKGLLRRVDTICEITTTEAKEYFSSIKYENKISIVAMVHQKLKIDEKLRKKGQSVPELVIDLDTMKNLELSSVVSGYNSYELFNRKQIIKLNPTTLFELKMGCYIEQIEKQTRESLKILRQKGYNTLESGYFHKFKGSQYFHLFESDIEFCESFDFNSINQKIEGVEITFENYGDEPYIEFIPEKFLDVSQWETVLNDFANLMPKIREHQPVAINEGSSKFAFEQISLFNKDHFLEMATCEEDIAYINKLYECKTRRKVEVLYESVNIDFLK